MIFKNLKELPFCESNYIKPKRFSYESNGKFCTWDFIESKDSVSILLYHKRIEKLYFCSSISHTALVSSKAR